MALNFFKVVNVKYKDGYDGDALLIDISKVKSDYDYVGLWYVRDGNELLSISTEIYASNEDNNAPQKPDDFVDEVKENHFKANNRLKLPSKYKYLWISTRVDNENYCKLKVGIEKEGKLYMNYQLIHHKDFGFKVLKNGIFKGGIATFYEIGSDDLKSALDYKDAVFYLVLIKGFPPEDWTIPDSSIGIENLPILSNVAKFSDNKRYSDWFGQNPLK
ncbi:MAG TPA: hypothetical protein PK771_05135 [Spirochaetota bacterium]|nr:hypothetical protein [Spirochaetota bacterium]